MLDRGYCESGTSEGLLVPTGERGLYEITDEVKGCLSRYGIALGVVTLYIQQTSASLLNPGERRSSNKGCLGAFFLLGLVPMETIFLGTLTREGPDDMPCLYPDGADICECYHSGEGWRLGAGDLARNLFVEALHA
ncbi:MAG: hypothetical protein M2R45_03417 [Verrucomicrobia subdivision 3 bacterium]|nr:hypothetical protein [Limisphaerales bacterium]MCS1416322.1 hypothetical protein [Limisphaerales bacterium]